MRSLMCGRSPNPETLARILTSNRRKNPGPWRADQAQIPARALPLPLAHEEQCLLERIGVEAAGEAAIRGDDNDADGLGLALLQKRMPVVGICLGQVADHVAHLLRVRTS